MAADQRKKRLSAANAFGHNSREQYKAKKKHFGSSQYDLNGKLNAHSPFKWEDNEKRAVAKREQIGLSKRDLIPFDTPVSHHNDGMADVVAVPKDMLELDDLTDVLSYEVWQSILTERERSYLMHFLPRVVSPDYVVEELLSGENLHFGNPFLKWCSSLCTGELHPEAVLHRERTFRANKKTYYSELQKYHDNMIRNLQKLKDRCASAEDPEAEIEKMMWRSRKRYGKNPKLVSIEVRSRNQGYIVAADDKASSSDNQNPTKKKGLELPRSKESWKDEDGWPVDLSDVIKVASKPKKREKLQNANVNCGDGSKYMSYVKISKSQHELVRSMKQSGNSIQSKALNCVFGNLHNFNVKPYVMFEEEEQKRIQEHWSNIAKRDVPSAFSNWRMIGSERRQILMSLCLEIEGKMEHLREEEETDNSVSTPYSQEKSVESDSTQQTQEDKASLDGSVSDDDQDSDSSFPEEQASLKVSSVDVNQGSNPMDLNEEDSHVSSKSNDACSMNQECHVTLEPSEESHSMSVCPEKKTHVDVVLNKEVPHSSASEVWPAVTELGTSCCTSTMDYSSCSSMSLKHPQNVEDEPAPLIDLESGIPEENPLKNLLPQQTDELPFFSSYQNDERHELLHTIVKCDNYHQEPKNTALGFPPMASLLMEPNQFPGHSQEPLHPSFPLETRLRAPSEFYLHPNIQENMYPESSRYSIPRPEQFPPINVRQWSNSPRYSAPILSRLNNSVELLSHNWFPVENRAQGGWSSSEVFSNPSLGSGSGGDQSLYSVLTQCSSLQSSAPSFNTVGSTDKFTPTGNLADDFGVGIPRRSNPIPQPAVASPLDYLSGHDIATAALKTGDMGWMNLPHQSSALHDLTGKPFPKPWN